MRTVLRSITTLMVLLLAGGLASCAKSCSSDTAGNSTTVFLLKIQLDPGKTSIAKGTQLSFTATGIYTDGSKQDLTNEVSWSSSDAATLAQVSGKNNTFTGNAEGQSTVSASKDGATANAVISVTAATLARLEAYVANATLPVGYTTELSLIGFFSDNSKQDLTGQATWQVGDAAIASVSGGTLTALKAGNTTLNASTTLDNAISANTSITVSQATLQSLQLRGDAASTPAGLAIHYSVFGSFSDGSERNVTGDAQWAIADPLIAEIEEKNATELVVKTLAAGSTSISASLNSTSTSTVLEVSAAQLQLIKLSPAAELLLARGLTYQVEAVGVYSDGSKKNITQQVTWLSQNDDFATVSNSASSAGMVTAHAETDEPVRISAIMPGTSVDPGRLYLAVTAASMTKLSVISPNSSVPNGLAMQLQAIATYSDRSQQNITDEAVWSADNANLTISNMTETAGLATGVAQGSTVVTASFGTLSAQTTINVTAATIQKLEIAPARIALAKGLLTQLQATVIYSDNSKNDVTELAKWTSSDTSVAVFDTNNAGLLHAIAQGTVNIAAEYGGTSSASHSVEVSAATLSAIKISSESVVLPAGTQTQLHASGVYSDDSERDVTANVVWVVSDTRFGVVENGDAPGRFTGVAAGVVLAAATLGDVSAAMILEVTPATLKAIEVEAVVSALPAGTQTTLKAFGLYTNSSRVNISDNVAWTSSNDAALTIEPGQTQAIARAISAAQNISITASLGDKTGATALSVTDAILTSIQVTPQNLNVIDGLTAQLTATGIYSDNSTTDLTHQVVWSSASESVLHVGNGLLDSGMITAIGPGNVIVTASIGDPAISGSTTVTVAAAQLTSITVSPLVKRVTAGQSVQIIATGLYDNGLRKDVTSMASWSVDDTNKASIVNSGTDIGLLSTGASAAGTITVTASIGDLTSTALVKIKSASLVGLSLEIPQTTLAVGTSAYVSAIAHYSDGSTQDVTELANWAVANIKTATVSNTAGKKGLVSAIDIGSTFVNATYGGAPGTLQVKVTSASLDSIAIDSGDTTMLLATTRRLRATGTFNDASTQDISHMVVWSSTPNTVVALDNSGRARGVATALATGSATVTVSYASLSANATVTVTDTIDSLAVTPALTSLNVGASRQLVATAQFTNAQTQDISSFVSWSTNNTASAYVANDVDDAGNLYGIAAGSATITAAYGDVDGTLALDIVDAPTQPVALSIKASPNMIFADNSDTSNVTIYVSAVDPDSFVPNPTQVDIDIVYGDGTLSHQQLSTTNGLVTLSDLKTAVEGTITITASIPDAGIENKLNIFATNSVGDFIARLVYSDPVMEGNVLKTGSLFGLAIKNISTRTIEVLSFSVSNNGEVLPHSETTDPTLLGGNSELAPTEVTGLGYVTESDLTDPVISARFALQDKTTLKTFDFNVTYTLP